MNAKAALDVLMGRLARSAPGLRASALNEMNVLQQTELEGGPELYWFLISEDATGQTVADERRVRLPSDFIREVDEKPLVSILDGEDDVKLIKADYEDAMIEFGTEAKGEPKVYCLRGDYLVFFPKPDDAYQLKLPGYYAKQPLIIDDVSFENAWLKWASDLLIAGTGLVIAGSYLKDPELAQLFAGQKLVAQDRLNKLATAREEANRERSKGDE